MDCIAVAQLIFPDASTEASFWSIFFSAHVTDWLTSTRNTEVDFYDD